MCEPLISRKEVARILGASENKIWRMTRDKQLRGFKVGGSVKYKESDLEQYLEKQSTLVLAGGEK